MFSGGGRRLRRRPYNNATFVPIISALIAALRHRAVLSWKRADLAGAEPSQSFAFAAVDPVRGAGLVVASGRPAAGAAGAALAGWMFIGTLSEFAAGHGCLPPARSCGLRRLPPRAWGMTSPCRHGGRHIGQTAAASWKQEDIRVLRPGESAAIGPTAVVR